MGTFSDKQGEKWAIVARANENENYSRLSRLRSIELFKPSKGLFGKSSGNPIYL